VTRIQLSHFATSVQYQILAFTFAAHELPVLRFIEKFMIQAVKGEIEEAVSLNLNILHESPSAKLCCRAIRAQKH
jgi:hypothetical protein